MTNIDYIECIVAVLNFNLTCALEYEKVGDFNTPSSESMNLTLNRHGFDNMVSFTEHLADNPMWVDSPREFFSDNENVLRFFHGQLEKYKPHGDEPYLVTIDVTADYKWNKDYDQDKECVCGHPYYRHFDTYEDMFACGCKYAWDCGCEGFEPKEK